MTNECFAILVSAPDFIEEGPLLHCTHCTKNMKKVSLGASILIHHLSIVVVTHKIDPTH